MARGTVYNMTQADEWCREPSPRNMRGVPIRGESW